MIRIAIISMALFLASHQATAQPRPLWVRAYGHPVVDSYFYDIYATADGGYVLCGATDPDTTLINRRKDAWIVRIDGDGGLIWQRSYDLVAPEYHDYGYSIIEADDGGFVVGGWSYNAHGGEEFRGFKTDADGDLIWNERYGGNYRGSCQAVIETKSGEYLFGGKVRDEVDFGYLVMTSEDGNPIWDRLIGSDTLSFIYTIREKADEGFILGGTAGGSSMVEIDFEGEARWARTYGAGAGRSLISTRAGYALGGYIPFMGENNETWYDFQLITTNRNGEHSWTRRYRIPNFMQVQKCMAITSMPEGGFYLVGEARDPNSTGAVVRSGPGGNVFWNSSVNAFGIAALLYGVICDRDGSALIVGSGVRLGEDQVRKGLIMKLPPERFAPRIVSYEPPVLDLSVLTGDSIDFIPHAVDEQGDSLGYSWFLGDSLQAETDSIYGIRFNDIGGYLVKSVVSDGMFADSITWHVTVTDFYISAYSPDTLNLSLGRGDSVDFSLDTIRAVEGLNDVQYLWLKSRVDGMDEVDSAGTESRAIISFMQSGNYAVEGLVYRGEASDAVTWNVSVRGVVWSFAPEDLALEVLPDSLIRFEVIPSNPEDSSLSARWFVDDEFAAEDTTSLDWGFFYPVHSVHFVHCVLADSIEADTISWTVTVRDLGVKDKRDAYPTRSAALLSVSPNPFNSTLTIRYSSPINREATSISIHDIAGREVFSAVTTPSVTEEYKNTVKRGGMTAERTLIWDASGIPAGVYFVRLQSGMEVSTKKVVLMR